MRYKGFLPVLLGLVAIGALACTGAANPQAAAPPPEPPPNPSPPSLPTVQAPTLPTATSEPPAVLDTPTPALGAVETPDEGSPVSPLLPPNNDRDARLIQSLQRMGWDTDFTKLSVSLDEIMSGGPPRDGIPPIDEPEYAPVSSPPPYMFGQEPVIALEIDGDARAYPLAVLIWHEIVNDEVGGVPVTVTYCPLCNTAITFDRRVDGRVLDFGTSGLLRNSDLVMWDRQTETWWQQITGEGIVGELTGTKLTFIPSPLIAWEDFVAAFPDGQVLTRNTGYSRGYGQPPYGGYDDIQGQPFLFRGEIDSRLPAMERVIGLEIDGETVAYPFNILDDNPVFHDIVGGQSLVVFFDDGTESAFAGAGGSDRLIVGSTSVYEPLVDGEEVSFISESGKILDEATGSEWNILGQAVSGPLEGTQLPAVVHANHFWFAWQAFNPETEVRLAEDFQG